MWLLVRVMAHIAQSSTKIWAGKQTQKFDTKMYVVYLAHNVLSYINIRSE